MIIPPGKLRIDILVLLAYQLLQMYSSQQTYLVYLQYTPPVGCFDDHCVKIVGKCYQPCPSCPDVCLNSTGPDRASCMEGHSYDFYSPMMEYRLKCRDDFYGSFSIAECQYLGVLIGNCFVGYLGDKLGRRLMLLAALCTGIPFLVLSAVFDSIPAFYAFRFLLGFTIAATMSVGWAFCAEMISPKHRFKLRTFTSWTNGRILMSILTFIGQNSWRVASYLNAAASLSTLAIIAYLPESPMWLKKKGKFERAEAANQRLEMISGVEREESEGDKGGKEKKKPVSMTLMQLFQDNKLRTQFLVLAVMWFCAGLSTYSIDLNGEDMTKNLFSGQFSVAALASIIRVIVGFADDWFPWLGRRLVYILSMGLCIIASGALLYELANNMKGSTLYFITYLIAYQSISVSWEPNYLGAAELMPTEVRAKTMALLNIISRVANVIAARVVGSFKGVWDEAILIAVLASNLFSFVVTVALLKETKNIKLESIGQKGDEKDSKDKSKRPSEDTSKASAVSREGPSESREESMREVPGEESKELSDATRLLSEEGQMFNQLTPVQPTLSKLFEKKSKEADTSKRASASESLREKRGQDK
uniref:MFS domain-containing protein n=1 Tax=Haemonchus contortus TaxID=6289 RepID=A0A7I4YMB9_HAECO